MQGCTTYAKGMSFAKTDIEDGHGKLYIFRQYIYLNGAFHPTIIINGEENDKIHNNGFLEYSLLPGEYTVGFSRAVSSNKHFKLIINEDEYTYLEIKLNSNLGAVMMGMPTVTNVDHFIQHDEKTAIPILSNSKNSIC